MEGLKYIFISSPRISYIHPMNSGPIRPYSCPTLPQTSPPLLHLARVPTPTHYVSSCKFCNPQSYLCCQETQGVECQLLDCGLMYVGPQC